jgi:hypothetical protein
MTRMEALHSREKRERERRGGVPGYLFRSTRYGRQVQAEIQNKFGSSTRTRSFASDFGSAGLSGRFESYPLVPGCHTFLIFHGIAEAFGLDAELA